MAHPNDYGSRPRKFKYAYHDEQRPETFQLSTPVRVDDNDDNEPPGRERMRYDGLQDLIDQVVDAISRTDWFTFVKKLMQQRGPAGLAGGEAAADSTDASPVAAVLEKRDNYNRLRRPDASLHYQRQDDGLNSVEHYRKREQSHRELCSAYDRFNESRNAISKRAAEYALRHGTDYDSALAAIGGNRPQIGLPTAAAC